MTQHLATWRTLYFNVDTHVMHGPPFFLFCLLASAQLICLVQEVQSAKDIHLTCFKTFPTKAATCLQVGPIPWIGLWILLQDFDHSRPSHSPEVPIDDRQRGALPASTRSRWRQNTLQPPPHVLQRIAGLDGYGPFFSGG